jgi:chaperonin GroEL
LYPNRDLLSEAMERVGKEGVITVQDGKTLHNELEVVEGMKFDRGYISPYFITDNKAQIVEFEKPLILLVEKRISSLASLIPLLENVVKNQRSLLIVAEVSISIMFTPLNTCQTSLLSAYIICHFTMF